MHSRIKPQTLGAQRLVQWGLVVRQHEAARWQRGGTKEGQQRDAELPGRLRSDTRLARARTSVVVNQPGHNLEHSCAAPSTQQLRDALTAPKGTNNEPSSLLV